MVAAAAGVAAAPMAAEVVVEAAAVMVAVVEEAEVAAKAIVVPRAGTKPTPETKFQTRNAPVLPGRFRFGRSPAARPPSPGHEPRSHALHAPFDRRRTLTVLCHCRVR